MPIPKRVFRWERIVPVRFTRCIDPADPNATSGPVRVDCPDPDDRGYTGAVHGPHMPVAFDSGAGTGDRAFVKLIRQDVEDAAALFVKVRTGEEAVLRIVSPAGGALPAQQNTNIEIQALAAGSAHVEIRFGGTAATDPMLLEMLVQVTAIKRVPVCLHRTETGPVGGPTAGPARVPLVAGVAAFAGADAMIPIVNRFWRPHGVEFFIQDRRQTVANFAGGIAGRVRFDTNTGVDDHTPLMGVNRRPNCINVHFVQQIGDGNTLGLGTTVTAAATYGVTLPDGANENDLAHELGHVMNLNFGLAPAGAHADDDPTSNIKRNDIWTRRRLMHSFNPTGPIAGTPARRVDVGYGPHIRGALVCMKDLANDAVDGEHTRAHAAVPNPLALP